MSNFTSHNKLNISKLHTSERYIVNAKIFIKGLILS